MDPTPPTDSDWTTSPGGSSTRSAIGPRTTTTAQPPLTSGFGALIQKETDLRAATEEYLDDVIGPRHAALDRLLRHQQLRLGANIALLEQRDERLPYPAGLDAEFDRAGALAKAPDEVAAKGGGVFELIAQHRSLLDDIGHLISRAPDGQRGELILAEVVRSHEEMGGMLTAFANPGASAGHSRG